MAAPLELYEHKILSDREFPVQLFLNRFHEKGWYFKEHWHEHLELHYVLEGEALFRLNKTDIYARKGDLVIANSNVLHGGYCDGSIKVLVLIFEMSALAGELADRNIIFHSLVKADANIEEIMTVIYQEYQNKNLGYRLVCKGEILKELADRNIIFHSLVKADANIEEIMTVIYQEYQNKNLGYRLVCKGEILKLIAYLARQYTAQVLTDSESDKRKKRLERLNTVLNFIQNHYMEPISNGDMARVIHLSEDRFNHLFKESMGMAPLQYVNEVRLKKAMNLLKKKEGTVAEIAAMVGYTDYNHFGRQFRKMFGATPSEVMKE